MVKKSILIFMALLLLLLLLLSTKIAALDPGRAVTQYKIDTWNDETGLPQNSIRALLQTSDGYLWIGTEEGLTRFDGVRFTTFDEDNTPEITNNYILSLFEDNEKNLWIGTRDGLLAFKNGTFKRYAEKEGLLYPVVYCISEDSSRNLWFGTDGGGLYLFKDNTFIRYTEKNGLPNNTITDIYCDSAGTLWIGTISGLCHFKNNKFTNYTQNDALSNGRVNGICEDSKNRIWIGCEKGVCKWEGCKITIIPMGIDSPNPIKINAIFEDKDKNIWIGTTAQGIFRYRNGEFSNLSKRNGLSDDAIYSIEEDREGSLWVGTVYGGLNCIKDGRFKTFGQKEGLSDDIVFAIHEDRNSDIWIGTNNGLNRIKNKQLTHFTIANGLTHNAVNVVCEDSNGFLWAGTDDGVNQLRILQSNIFKVNEFVRGDSILGMFVDSYDNLWVGTVRGLVKIKGQNEEWFTKKDGLGANVINFIYEDKSNHLWISTFRGGLTTYKDGKFTVYTKKNGLVNNSINCIYQDGEGVLWIGTINGLSRFKEGRFTNYTKKQGLFNNNIYQILEDKKENLWMSCNKGIFRVGKKALNDYADGKIKRIRSISYGKDDGMRSSECNGGLQYAGCKTKDGKLWFATTKGAVIIDPENIPINQVPPPVFIEEVLLDGVSTDINKEIILTPGIKRIELHYTALSFLNPKKVKFKYILEGYEEQWLDAETQRVACYTNLDPGEYRFKVIACNNDGIWNEKGSSIAFVVIPPFWLTWWFRALLVLFFLFLIVIVLSWRIKQAKRKIAIQERNKQLVMVQKMELLGILASGAVHDLKNLLAIIIGYSKIAVQHADQKDEKIKPIENIKSTALTAVQVVKQILAFTRQTYDKTIVVNLPDLLEDVLEILKVTTPAEVKILWEAPKEEVRLYISPTKFQQAVMNLCLNAVQAMPGEGKLNIRLYKAKDRENQVILEVSDTGIGIEKGNLGKIFDPLFTTKEPGKGTGLGLFVVKQIVDEYKGKIEVRSKPGEGTTFKISFPSEPTG
jgi:ligand-binding sensor domain-containing protein/signal transduction histidine kinase